MGGWRAPRAAEGRALGKGGRHGEGEGGARGKVARAGRPRHLRQDAEGRLLQREDDPGGAHALSASPKVEGGDGQLGKGLSGSLCSSGKFMRTTGSGLLPLLRGA